MKSTLKKWTWASTIALVITIIISAIVGTENRTLSTIGGLFTLTTVTLWVIVAVRRGVRAAPKRPTYPSSSPVTSPAARYPATPRTEHPPHREPEPQPAATPAPAPVEHLRETRTAYYLVGADGYAGTEVAGEFARINDIHRAIGRAPLLDEEIEEENLTAALVPEPSNPHDRNAVTVQINGYVVGYLEREDAAKYQPLLNSVIAAGYVPATRARVWTVARSGWDNQVKYYARVTVALNPPHLIIPVNDPPNGEHSILPWGNALQVTGEEDHQDVLADYVTPEGDAIALGTLHIITGGAARAPKELIEVRFDGERIGQLTPVSSKHYVPAVRHLDAQGIATCAWMRVKGSAIAAQVTIQAARAHELPADWFEAPHTLPRLRSAAQEFEAEGAIDDADIRAVMREPMWDDEPS